MADARVRFWSIIAVLIGVVLAAHVIVEKIGGVDLPERLGSIGWGVMHLAGGAIAFIFVIIKAVSNDGLDRKIGLWLGLLCSARAARRRLPDGEGSAASCRSSSVAGVAPRRLSLRLRHSRTHNSLEPASSS